MKKLIAGGLAGMAASLFGAAGGAIAQDLTPALIECREIGDDSDRLACFDRLASGLDASVRADAETAPPQPVLTAEERFGAEDLAATQEEKRREREKIKSLSASVVDIARNGRGKYVVILENGQIWRQLAADMGRLRVPTSGAEGMTVEIKRRTLGSHSLYLDGDNRGIKVERIK